MAKRKPEEVTPALSKETLLALVKASDMVETLGGTPDLVGKRRRILRTVRPILGTNLTEWEAGVSGMNPAAPHLPRVLSIADADYGVDVNYERDGEVGVSRVPWTNILEFIDATFTAKR